jgi:type I restriction enzyme, S subunit
VTTLSPEFKQTEAGLIPIGWDAPSLDSVARRGSGHTPDKKHPEYWNGDIKWLSLRDSEALDKLFIEQTAATITRAGIANSSAVIHPAGTVVLSRDAGVGKSAIMKTSMAVSQHFMAWQCGPTLENTYLYYWLQSKKSEFERIAMGSTIKTIGLPYFRTLKIPRPPLREQKAIAAALGECDALLFSLDALIAKKRDLKQAAMQQLLTGTTRLEGFHGSWGESRLGSVTSMRSGGTPDSKVSRFYGGPFPWVSISDMTLGGKVITATARSLSAEGLAASTAQVVPAGTLLYAMYASLGECGIAGLPLCASQAILAISPSANLNPEFLYYVLLSRKTQVKTLGQQGTQSNLNKRMVQDFVVPIPPIGEQRAISTALSDIDADIASLEARRDKTRALKQGMMQELLTGRIRLI